jgi:hypothetical protein
MRAVGGAPIIEIFLDIEGARWLALPEAPDQLNSYPLGEIRLSKCLPVFAAVGTKHIPG